MTIDFEPRLGTSPDKIAGLRGWYKTDSGLYQDSGATTLAKYTGDRIGYWQDRSGNGLHFDQTTAGWRGRIVEKDAQGFPAINFNGADEFLQTSTNLIGDSDPFTVFMFGSTNSTTTNFGPLFTRGQDGDGAGWSVLIYPHLSAIVTVSGGATSFAVPGPHHYTNRQKNLVVSRWTPGVGLSHWANNRSPNTILTTTTTLRSSGRNIVLGGGATTTTFTLGGFVELVVYNVALDDNQIRSVQAYFNNKYKIWGYDDADINE